MEVKPVTENLDEALAQFSDDVRDMVKEENPLVESATQNVKDSVEQLESSIPEPEEVAVATVDAQEKEAELEEKTENLSKNIESTMKNSPTLLNKLKGMANKLMKKFGGSSEVMEKLDEKKASSLPLFMKKKFSFALPPFINLLKRKNKNGSNDKFIEKLEAMNTNIQSDVDEAKKKGFFNRTKEAFSNFKKRFTWKRGGKKRRSKRKTSKKIGGDDGEALIITIGWLVCLAICCSTIVGCIVCGPLFILSVCMALGIDCSAGLSVAAEAASSAASSVGSLASSAASSVGSVGSSIGSLASSASPSINFENSSSGMGSSFEAPSLGLGNSPTGMGSPSGVPGEVGMGLDALNTYQQSRIANSWIPGQGKGNDKYRQAAALQSVGNLGGGKRRSKRNKRKSVKRSRTHKK
jgi:hypothetical protein